MEGFAIQRDDGTPEVPDTATVPVCTFGQGRHRLGVPLAALRAVLEPCPIFLLPTVPESILGVIHWRGEVIPLLDGRRVFAGENHVVGGESRFLVFENGGVPVAVRTAGVPTITALAPAEIVAEGGIELPPYVRALCSYAGDLIYLLDIEGLLAAHRP
ncbi:MAG TPA: chemotaxis protein CheW [bacterium]